MESCKTVVSCPIGLTETVKVEVGLHPGAAPNTFWFIKVMDRPDEVRQKTPESDICR